MNLQACQGSGLEDLSEHLCEAFLAQKTGFRALRFRVEGLGLRLPRIEGLGLRSRHVQKIVRKGAGGGGAEP